MTKDAIIVLCAAIGGALLFGGIEVFGGDHDPGAVFPWQFMAIVLAVAGGLAGLFGSFAFLVLRWLVHITIF